VIARGSSVCRGLDEARTVYKSRFNRSKGLLGCIGELFDCLCTVFTTQRWKLILWLSPMTPHERPQVKRDWSDALHIHKTSTSIIVHESFETKNHAVYDTLAIYTPYKQRTPSPTLYLPHSLHSTSTPTHQQPQQTSHSSYSSTPHTSFPPPPRPH
jgi:hypothetical protein